MNNPRVRPILQFPTKLAKPFPERSDDWPDKYPALVKPWIGGVRAYWIESLQAFQLEEDEGRLVRVDGIEPQVPDGISGRPAPNLLGEFWEKGTSYQQILDQVVTNRPGENLDFNIYDAEFEAPATERATYCLQIPKQYDFHVRIVEMYEIWTPGGFRTFLEGWRKAFKGGLAVAGTDPWLATEYEVRKLL